MYTGDHYLEIQFEKESGKQLLLSLPEMLSRLRFVKSEEEDLLLSEAVEVVRGNGVDPVWVTGDLPQGDRGSIYVLDNFDSALYKTLAGKCRIIGPAVVLAHWKHGWPLPASMQPVFSMAMHGVVACCTQTGNRERRERLCELVRLMGGRVSADFTRHVTHLIAGQVGSTKYKVARDRNMPVVLPSWVESCWEEGLQKVVYATDPEMLSLHHCPPFSGCTISVTGLDEKTRMRVSKLTEEHGGTYSGELTKDVCTHLLVGNTSSTKYKFARQWHISCVVPQWFFDSVERGYCCPEEEYGVEPSGGGGREGEKKRGRGEEVPEWASKLQEFKVPSVSDSYFLDGCKLYFSGFSEEQLGKLHRIVNLGGGARFNQLSATLSHIVMGKQTPSEVTSIKQLGCCPFVVSSQWLLDCCTRGEQVSEEKYLCLQLQPPAPSPMPAPRKRKLDLVCSEGDQTRKRVCVEVEEGEEDLMRQYAAAELPDAPPTNPRGVLAGVEVSVSPLFLVEDQGIAAEVVRSHGGTVVSAPRGSYLLVPLEEAGETSWRDRGARPVTMIWLQRCIEAGSLLDPTSYFLFQPMATPLCDTTLTGCVLAFSQFSDMEREHLVRFSRGLGAIVQDHFARYPAHGLLATTHLVLKHPSGEKLSFALKWGIPAVSDSWLFACATAQKIVSVDNYLMRQETTPQNSQTGPTESGGHPTGHTESGGHPSGPTESGGHPTGHTESGEQPSGPTESGGHPSGHTESGEHPTGHTESGGHPSGHTESGGHPSGHTESGGHPSGHTESGGHPTGPTESGGHPSGPTESGRHPTDPIESGGISLEKPSGEIKLPFKPNFDVKEALEMLPSPQPGINTQLAEMFEENMQKALETVARLEEEARKKRAGKNEPPQNGTLHKSSLEGTPEPEPAAEEEEEKEEEEEEEGNRMETTEEVEPPQAVDKPLEVARRMQQQLEEMRDAPREQKKRRSKRLMRQEEVPPVPPPLRRSPAAGRPRRSRRTRKKEEPLMDSQVSDSQLLQVTYDDPEGRREKAKLMAQIERDEKLLAQGIDPRQLRDAEEEVKLVFPPLPEASLAGTVPTSKQSPAKTRGAAECKAPSKSLRRTGVAAASTVSEQPKPSDEINDRDLPSSTPAPPPLIVPIVTHSKDSAEVKSLYDDRAVETRSKTPSPPKFLFSSLDQREKVDYGALVQELGGEYIDLDYFTTACTHLVVGKASRTEKYLGACAAGKWVLHKSYLEACRAASRFVEEEPHEWGVRAPGTEIHPLEAAPRKWRQLLAERKKSRPAALGGEGAFQGWKVLLFAERNKLPGLRRLLEAGGAQVLRLSSVVLKEVTHAFISISHFPKETLSLEAMVKQGIHCLKPDYIAEFLSKEEVQMESLYINEVKPFLQR